MKIGLFVSENNGDLKEHISIAKIRKKFQDIDYLQVLPDFHQKKYRQEIIEKIKIEKLDAVILAGNSPKFYESSLSGMFIIDNVKEQGINPNKIAIANIFEQAAWTYSGNKSLATEKAIAAIEIARAHVELSHPITYWTIAPRRSVLIIGKTIGGIISAERFLEMGFKVYLIDKETKRDEFDIRDKNLDPLISYVQAHQNYHEITGVKLNDVRGWCGDYTIEIENAHIEYLRVGGILLAIEDNSWIASLRPLLQLDIDSDGKIRARNVEFLPVQTFDDGIVFLPSLNGSHETKNLLPLVDSAVLSLHRFLDEDEILHEVKVSEVNEEICGGCGTCIKICSFKANSIDNKKSVSVIDPRRCKGCGRCVVACPIGARDLMTAPNLFIEKAIEILSRYGNKNDQKILALLCNGCGYPAADAAGKLIYKGEGVNFPENVLPLRVECGGRIDCQHVLRAFKTGFDGVFIARCHEGRCHNIVGNVDMDRRINLLREVLRTLGFNSEQLRIVNIAYNEGEGFIEKINKFYNDLKEMEVVKNV